LIYRGLQSSLPAPVRRYILHFEAAIEEAVAGFASGLAPGARILDAGAGEGSYKHLFAKQRYTGVDLGIGDSNWNYASLDAIADLTAIPFHDGTFDAAINVVTLEHVREPEIVIAELARVLKRGGQMLLIVPHEWEEHQIPHDFFRYTRYGVQHLLEKAGLKAVAIEPVGGFFRLLSRRLFNALQFFPGPLFFIAALFFGPPALVMPLLDGLDKERRFTMGFICRAEKSYF
jgi:SAM-dependent methyltransferase